MAKITFDELSNQACSTVGCNRRIKQRLVNDREPANRDKCYRCYNSLKKLEMSKQKIKATRLDKVPY